MKTEQCVVGLGVMIVALFSFISSPAQEKKPQETPKQNAQSLVVKAVTWKEDVLIYLPKGMDYEVLGSEVLRERVKPARLKSGAILVMGHRPVFVQAEGDKVTFLLTGTTFREIRIGLPKGCVGMIE